MRHVRDESHRFALKFQRSHRSKRIQSELNLIPGLGERKIRNLYKHFKSFDKIKQASIEELVGVNQINETFSKKIYKFFHSY